MRFTAPTHTSGLLVASGTLAALLASAAACDDDPIVQPLEFSHAKHAEEEIDCDTCHQFFDTQTFSGLPEISDCMDCHEEALGDSPREKALRELAQSGGELKWERLFRVPDHVYYSHRRHVVIAKLVCTQCHGDMGKSERPPPGPTVDHTMEFCLDCHEESGAATDCVACHR